VRTYFSDVLAVHYKEAGAGRMLPLTEDSPLADVETGGLLRLTRDSKVRRRAQTSARITAKSVEPDTAAICFRHDDDEDDDDAFERIMESQERSRGVLTLHSAAPACHALLPTPAAASEGRSSRRGVSARGRSEPPLTHGHLYRGRGGDGSGGSGGGGDDDDSDLIYRLNLQQDAARTGARSMAL
jgi:hypothetical protein